MTILIWEIICCRLARFTVTGFYRAGPILFTRESLLRPHCTAVSATQLSLNFQSSLLTFVFLIGWYSQSSNSERESTREVLWRLSSSFCREEERRVSSSSQQSLIGCSSSSSAHVLLIQSRRYRAVCRDIRVFISDLSWLILRLRSKTILIHPSLTSKHIGWIRCSSVETRKSGHRFKCSVAPCCIICWTFICFGYCLVVLVAWIFGSISIVIKWMRVRVEPSLFSSKSLLGITGRRGNGWNDFRNRRSRIQRMTSDWKGHCVCASLFWTGFAQEDNQTNDNG